MLISIVNVQGVCRAGHLVLYEVCDTVDGHLPTQLIERLLHDAMQPLPELVLKEVLLRISPVSRHFVSVFPILGIVIKIKISSSNYVLYSI